MLRLPFVHKRAIEQHGEQGYPDEVCGFLIGRAQGDAKTVEAITPIENAWAEAGHAPEFAAAAGADFAGETRRRRFTIPPDEYYQADKDARAASQSVLGFYHSHPDHLARPSQYDLRLAQEIFPGYSYIIVAVHNGKAVELTDWVLRDDGSRFDAEPINEMER